MRTRGPGAGRGCAGSGRLGMPLALAGMLLAGPASTLAQAPDIEAVAKMRGIELPPAHFEMLRQDPDLYTFERALFNRVGPERTATSGTVELPVVLVLFADSREMPHISVQDVQNALFDDAPERGTTTEAYLEMSRGALTVTGEVFGWARSSLPMDSVVGGNFGLGSDNRIGEFFTQALDQLDAEIDFTRFDNDGPDGVANSGDDDGFVDVITFEYLEVAASCGGPSIWPHRSRMSSRTGAPYVTDDIGIGGDTIRIQDYITQSATDCTGEGVQDAAVIAHEFGHALGLPDWYHWVDSSLGPYGRRWVLGCWALMAAGSWGCGPVEDRVPFGPTNMIGFSKDYLGWIDFTDPGEVWNDTIMLGPVRTTGEALRIPMDDEGREFLIAEYRDTGGFDRYLPGEGVLLYREDTSLGIGSKPDPTTDDPYPLQMIERDANNSLLEIAGEGGSRGEIGDAWGVDGAAHRLTATTTPALRRASGAWSFVQIHEVAVANDSARIVLSTGRTPLALAPEGPVEVMRIRTFRAPVRVFGGVGPYTGVGTLPDGFVFESGGDELFVVGSVREEGPQVFTFAVRDQNGAETDEVSITVSGSIGWEVSTARMLQRFLDSSEDPLTVGELGYLDETGNGNGRYDVGDLRAWLRENR